MGAFLQLGSSLIVSSLLLLMENCYLYCKFKRNVKKDEPNIVIFILKYPPRAGNWLERIVKKT